MKIAIIGLGLIGGSIAFALKDFQSAEIIGCDISASVCDKAVRSGAVSKAYTDSKNIIPIADLVILCVYPEKTIEILRNARFKPGAVITELCGVKSELTQIIDELLPDNVDYVPCHPMAGKEVEGFDNAEAEIFLGAGFIITPVAGTKPESIDLIKQIAVYIGASEITCVPAEEHDQIIAYSSHLCHLSALALCLDYPANVSGAFLGGSFRDCTRVANVNTALWSSLFLNNRENVLSELKRYTASIGILKAAIEDGDAERLGKLLSIAGRNKAVMRK